MTDQIKQSEDETRPVDLTEDLSDEALDRGQGGTYACWKSITAHTPEA